MAEPVLKAEIGGAFNPRARGRIPGHNLLQSAILLALKLQGTGVAVVGDDCSRFNAFRGATRPAKRSADPLKAVLAFEPLTNARAEWGSFARCSTASVGLGRPGLVKE